MHFEEKNLGTIKGKQVIGYKLINDKNMSVTILNYGGIIKEIMVPDKNGKVENVVLSFKDVSSYEKCGSYLGAIVGRTSGRVYKGQVNINGEVYNLSINNGENNLHGGLEGFSRKFWDCEVENNKDNLVLNMKLFSKDMEEGLPGNVNVEVKYTLDNENSLTIEYYAKSDKDTLINMTNHTYFNLSGNNKKDILDSYMEINADKYYELSENNALSGEISWVGNTPFDFRHLKKISKDINSSDRQINLGNGYDHIFKLNEKNNIKKVDATLCEPDSGRILDIYTDMPAVVVYTSNYGEKEEFEDGTSNQIRRGICFETQKPSIGVDEAFKELSLIKANEEYKSKTKFKFLAFHK